MSGKGNKASAGESTEILTKLSQGPKKGVVVRCSSHPRAKLVERLVYARAGCAKCFDILFTYCLDCAYTAVADHGGPGAMWLEVEHEITERIVNLIQHAYDPARRRSSITGYVRTMAKNVLVGKLRIARDEQYRHEREIDAASEKIVSRVKRFLAWLQEAGLDASEVAVATQMYAQGKSADEIADSLQIPADQVRDLVNGARQKLVEWTVRQSSPAALSATQIDLIVTVRVLSWVSALRLDARALVAGVADNKEKPSFRKLIKSVAKKRKLTVTETLVQIEQTLSILNEHRDSGAGGDGLEDLVDDLVDDLRDDEDWVPHELAAARLTRQAEAQVTVALQRADLPVSADDLLQDAIATYCVFLIPSLALMPESFHRKINDRNRAKPMLAAAWKVLAGRIFPGQDVTDWLCIAARIWFIQHLDRIGSAFFENLPFPVYNWFQTTTR